jgi:hypothetical protein
VTEGKITKTGDSYTLVVVKGALKAKAAPKIMAMMTAKKKAAPKKKARRRSLLRSKHSCMCPKLSSPFLL